MCTSGSTSMQTWLTPNTRMLTWRGATALIASPGPIWNGVNGIGGAPGEGFARLERGDKVLVPATLGQTRRGSPPPPRALTGAHESTRNARLDAVHAVSKHDSVKCTVGKSMPHNT